MNRILARHVAVVTNGGRAMGTPVTVVVVGDDDGWGADPARLRGVRLLARTDDPRRALRLVDQARPQVVLAGLGRRREAVLAVVAELAARAPVLAVAAGPRTGSDVLAAVQAGATGYLVAGDDPVALAAAVRRTAAGDAVFSPGLAEVVLEQRRGPDAAQARLTTRETDVLTLVVDGLTARQIATRLVLSPRTVEHHVQRVLRRVGVPNRAALVRHAIENGLV